MPAPRSASSQMQPGCLTPSCVRRRHESSPGCPAPPPLAITPTQTPASGAIRPTFPSSSASSSGRRPAQPPLGCTRPHGRTAGSTSFTGWPPHCAVARHDLPSARRGDGDASRTPPLSPRSRNARPRHGHAGRDPMPQRRTCPGRDEMHAKRRPTSNWCPSCSSSLWPTLRSLILRCTALDRLGGSPSDFFPSSMPRCCGREAAHGRLTERKAARIRRGLRRGRRRARLSAAAAGPRACLQVVLLERRGIDRDDRVLHDGLRADQLVVGGVVHDVQDARLARHSLRAPGEVPRVQAQRPELPVATPHAKGAHRHVGGELGVGGLTAQLVLLRLPPVRAPAARGAPLVQPRASDPCTRANARRSCRRMAWGARGRGRRGSQDRALKPPAPPGGSEKRAL